MAKGKACHVGARSDSPIRSLAHGFQVGCVNLLPPPESSITIRARPLRIVPSVQSPSNERAGVASAPNKKGTGPFIKWTCPLFAISSIAWLALQTCDEPALYERSQSPVVLRDFACVDPSTDADFVWRPAKDNEQSGVLWPADRPITTARTGQAFALDFDQARISWYGRSQCVTDTRNPSSQRLFVSSPYLNAPRPKSMRAVPI